MKRILQIAAPALALVLVLALAVPALAASTCNTNTVSTCSNVRACLAKNSLTGSDVLAKLKEYGLCADTLRNGPICLNGKSCTTPDCITVDCDGTQCTTAADCATTACADKAKGIVTEETAVEAASYQREDEAVIDEAAAGQAAADKAAVDQAVTDDVIVEEDDASVESTVNDAAGSILNNYASGKSGSCPTGSSVIISKSYSTGSKNGSSCPKSNSDIQSAAAKLLEQTGKFSCSSGESAANVSDILSQLQNSGYSICNK